MVELLIFQLRLNISRPFPKTECFQSFFFFLFSFSSLWHFSSAYQSISSCSTFFSFFSHHLLHSSLSFFVPYTSRLSSVPTDVFIGSISKLRYARAFFTFLSWWVANGYHQSCSVFAKKIFQLFRYATKHLYTVQWTKLHDCILRVSTTK